VEAPSTPKASAWTKYKIPISLWLHLVNHNIMNNKDINLINLWVGVSGLFYFVGTKIARIFSDSTRAKQVSLVWSITAST